MENSPTEIIFMLDDLLGMFFQNSAVTSNTLSSLGRAESFSCPNKSYILMWFYLGVNMSVERTPRLARFIIIEKKCQSHSLTTFSDLLKEQFTLL